MMATLSTEPRSLRRTRILGIAALSLWAPACGETSPSGPADGPWLAERPTAEPPDHRTAHWSHRNVSRPLWTANAPREIELRGSPDAFVELELGLAPGQAAAPASPPSAILILDIGGLEHRASLEEIPRPGDEAGRWSLQRASLAALPAGSASLHLLVDGRPLFQQERWVATRPRIYQQRDQSERWNLLWITLDTVRADYLGSYGHGRPTSPRLDRLAAEGFRFERCISQASWTLPAMVSLFTGLYPESHGVIHSEHRMADGMVSFVERLAAAGFSTAAFVSGTFTDSFWGMAQGYDLYDDFGMVVDDQAANPDDPQDIDAWRARSEARITSPEVTDRALDWLRRHRDRRFCLHTHYFDPHQDYVEHAEYQGQFAPLRLTSSRLGQADPNPPRTAQWRATYENEIAFTDAHIGRLLDGLTELGLADRTLVVLAADHGEEFFERQWWGHGNSVFNELVWVPLILRAPDPALVPRSIREPVANVDVAPTILELLGVEVGKPPEGGVSLVPLLRDPAASRPGPVFTSLYDTFAPAPGQRGELLSFRVDADGQTFIHDSRLRGRTAWLFDWQKDRLQLTDIAARQRETARRLEQAFRSARPRLEAGRPEPDELILSPELTDILKSLGYVEEK